MGNHSKLKKRAAFLAFLLALGLFLAAATSILTPKRDAFGANWEMFLKEVPDSIDVMLLGTSLTYCDVIPAILYEETGLSAYALAGPTQTPALTYYYAREMYNTQSPGLVVLELSGLLYEKYMEYSTVNVTYMPWTVNRLLAAREAAERADWPGLLFPIYAFHTRWSSLTRSDFTGCAPDNLAGYTYLTDAISEENLQKTVREVTLTEAEFSENLRYLALLLALFRENGSQIVLYCAPTHTQYPVEYQTLLKSAAGKAVEAADVTFWDFSGQGAPLGIVTETDFYDATHLNVRGAVKFTAQLAALLSDFAIPRKAVDTALWDGRAAYFHALPKEAAA